MGYKSNGVPTKYRVDIVSIPSNLGKGAIWYFVCPKTQKRYRKLYLVAGYFYHRSAFNGCMYETQTLSRSNRSLFREYHKLFGKDSAEKQIYSKYFKKIYKNKPTKLYLLLLKQVSKTRNLRIGTSIVLVYFLTCIISFLDFWKSS